MGMIDDQYDRMKDMALNERQERAIEDARKLTHSAADGMNKALTNLFNNSEPPPPKTSSSGGGLGGLLVLGALAGGAYLLSKAFGSDDKKSSNSSSNSSSNDNKSANDYLISGNNYYNQQKYSLAIKEYSKAIRLNPNFAEAYNNRGMAYNALGGNKYNAQADFDRAKFLSENF